MIVALISSEANLAKADHYRDISRKLAYVRGVSPEAARALARDGKAVVWIDNGLHASEVATAQHAFLLAHRVATEESVEMREIRDNVILVLLPTVNPDGMNLVVDWYRKNLNTPNQDSPMPWLYQKYIGHDNNRDAYMQTQAETRVVNTLLYKEWLPQIMYNQHQAGWPPPRMFVPPFPDPFNPNIDSQVIRGIDLVGGAMLDRFERERKPGVVSRYQFSTWYNGSIRTAAYFHNMIGILTETWHPSATPFTYDPKRFPREFDNGVSTTEPSTSYPSPWMGGTVRLADAVDYMLTGSLAVLQVAAKYREQFLLGIYQIGARQIEKGATDAPVAYVIPPEQHDPPAAALFVETLMRGAVEVHRADGPFSADGTLYPAGTWVVRMDQPFRPFAKDLLEPQRYPDLRTSAGRTALAALRHRRVDAGLSDGRQRGRRDVAVHGDAHAADRLPAHRGSRGAAAARACHIRRRARPWRVPWPTPACRRVGAGTYAIEPRANAAFRAVNRLLAAGVAVTRVPRRSVAAGRLPAIAAQRRLIPRHGQGRHPGPATGRRRGRRRRRGAADRSSAAHRDPAGARGAGRPLQELGRQHGRGVDAVAARAVRVPVHDAHRRRRAQRRAPRSLRRDRPAGSGAAAHRGRPSADRPAARRSLGPGAAGVSGRDRRGRRRRAEAVRAGRRTADHV